MERNQIKKEKHGYEVCPESTQPCTMKNRDLYWRRYKIQDTVYIGQWCLSPLQSRNLGTSHSSPSISSTVQNTLQNPLLESPSAALSYFPESHQQSEISSLSKVILVLGKARSHRVPNLGCKGAEFNVLRFCLWQAFQYVDRFQEILNHLWSICATLLFVLHCTNCITVCCHCIIPNTLLNHPNSFCRGMFKLNTKFDANLLLYLLSHFDCDSHTVPMLTQWCLPPHWPVQGSRHCSHLHISLHSPWLPGHINVMQTVLIMLTMAGLFTDRPRMSSWDKFFF